MNISQRFKRFCTVGVLNTAIDVGIYTLLQMLGVPSFMANLASTSAGFAVGYLLHSRYTFRSGGGDTGQLAKFTAVTLLGLWLLQPLLIHLFTLVAGEMLEPVVGDYRLASVLIPKLAAIGGVMIWNYS